MKKKNIVLKNVYSDYAKLHAFHGNPLFDLKNGAFLQKYSYLTNKVANLVPN